MTKLTRPVLGLLASASAWGVFAIPALAQLPEGQVAVSSFHYTQFPGPAGIFFVDPNPPFTITPVTGLPCELTGGCNGSAGANFVLRDPRTEHLFSGPVVFNGGPIRAFAMILNGSTVVSTTSVLLGNIAAAYDGGVNGAAMLPNGDVLLAVGRVASGPAANRPLMRWTPATGALVPVTIQPIGSFSYYTGNFCNAVTVTPDGQRAIAALHSNLLWGNAIQFDVVEVDLATGASTLLTQLPLGEYVTQFAWGCDGDFLAVTARYPLGTGGRLLRWGWTTAGWSPVVSSSFPGLRDFNGMSVDPASCVTYLNPNVLPGPPYDSHLYALPSGATTPVLVSTGAPTGWSILSGIEVNPNPEVTEAATAAPNGFAPRWSYRPFPGGRPLLGSTFGMQVITGPTGSITGCYLSLGRQTWTGPFGLQLYLDPTSMTSIGLLPNPDPVFNLVIPNSPYLLGVSLFGQAAAADITGAIGATELLSFTIV